MDKDRIDGAAEQAKGSVKEAIGKLTGDRKTQVEGSLDKHAAEAKVSVVKAKDAARPAVHLKKT